MLIALLPAAVVQATAPPPPAAVTLRPALPALCAKAPGTPEYGLHVTSPLGQFVFTNLSYSPATPKGSAALPRAT